VSWGTLQVGRIVVRETYELSFQVNASSGEQSVTITGMESSPPLTSTQLRARQEDFISLLNQQLPVIFSTKNNQSGFYEVTDVGTDLTTWPEAEYFNWNLSLKRIGTASAIDIESRMANAVRQNVFSLTGERWHTPALLLNYGTYTTGSVAPSSMLRDADPVLCPNTPLKVYRGIPAGVNPLWGTDPASYLSGRVRFLTLGEERSGVGFSVDRSDWRLENGLVAIQPFNGAGVKLYLWDAGSATYDTQNILFTYNGTNINALAWSDMTVIRNDLECVILRGIVGRTSGRIIVDFTLRRGSRFVEVFIQSSVSATLGVKTSTTVATTDSSASGYIVASANTTAGNRVIIGSAKTFTGGTVGAITKSTTTQLDAFIGFVYNGDTAISGDTAADLMNQYIGAMPEQAVVVKR
jgi:hypothetical protein